MNKNDELKNAAEILCERTRNLLGSSKTLAAIINRGIEHKFDIKTLAKNAENSINEIIRYVSMLEETLSTDGRIKLKEVDNTCLNCYTYTHKNGDQYYRCAIKGYCPGLEKTNE